MAVLTDIASYLYKSVQSPLLAADPCYSLIMGEIPAIIVQASRELGYKNVIEVPFEEEALLILHAKKELYWRFATAMAPNMNLELEYTKITKSKRFDHYFKLLGAVQDEIDKVPSSISVADVLIRSREGTARNYALSGEIEKSVSANSITPTSANIEWTLFDTSKGTLACYDVLVSKENLYDEYSLESVNYAKADKRITIPDVKRSKIRITELTPNTLYYVVLVYRALNRIHYATTTFCTEKGE